MVTAPHPILLRPPLLFERTEQKYVDAMYQDLKTPEGRQRIREQALAVKTRGMRLKQPVHKAYNIMLLDAACDGYGYPRLDPRKIVDAGIVVRRLLADEKGVRVSPEQFEAWVSEDRKFKGWITYDNPADLDQDPDPKFRRAPFVSGHAGINKRLVVLAERHFRLSESYSPAFVVPPDVCEASGRTLIYGGVTVSSVEVAEAEAVERYSEEEMMTGFSTLFTEGPERPLSAPAMAEFVRQVAAEYGAFNDEPAERALFNVLNQLIVPIGGSPRAGEYLRSVYSRIYERTKPESVTGTWPAISSGMAQQLKSAVFAVKQARLASFRPNTGRFEDSRAYYRARMFLRIKNHPECPPQLWWSEYTEPFQIVPWYEHSGPPVKIVLPDINKDTVRNLKPNVAFQLPPGLFNLLAKNTPDNFLKGEAQDGGGIGIAWLCSFSLPIITLCAFIVLNIFLQLFNIVFFWMLYIKICIPIPIPKKKGG